MKINKLQKFYCKKCGATTFGIDYCDNPDCPNKPCCGLPKELCDCVETGGKGQREKLIQDKTMINYWRLTSIIFSSIAIAGLLGLAVFVGPTFSQGFFMGLSVMNIIYQIIGYGRKRG